MNYKLLKIVFLLSILELIFCYTNDDVNGGIKLKDDPALHPGHLKPLGAFQPRTEIETLTEFPKPLDYYVNYIKPGRPFLVKKGAVNQGAYKLWTDEYMKSFPEAATEQVAVEPNLKEIREAKGFEIPFKDFVERYHKEKIYMVNKVPSFLQKDVLMPPPLRCNNTRKLMLDHVTWMSTGGTKSVLHNDDLDNINCLFRGSKELLFINPNKYEGKVPIDRPQGGYSSLDVDKVNFTKFPALREVEYIHCKMEEGDCLFIPWRWYHQVNSVANEDNQNIAVNIWFNHDADHIPEDCELPEEEATLDKFHFAGMESIYGGAGEEQTDSQVPLLDLFEMTLNKTKHNRASFKTFVSILTKVPGIFAEESLADVTLTKDFVLLSKELYDKLNVVESAFVDKADFDQIELDATSEIYETWLQAHMNKMQDIIKDQLTDEHIDDAEITESISETIETTDNASEVPPSAVPPKAETGKSVDENKEDQETDKKIEL